MSGLYAAEPRSRSRTLLLLVWGAWTIYGVVNGTLWGLANRAPLKAFGWTYPSALVVAWFWALVTPVVFAAARRWRPGRVGWVSSIAAHSLLALLCGAAATVVRTLAVRFFGGFTGDKLTSVFLFWIDVWVFIYLTLLITGRALDLRRRYADRQTRADLLEAQLARAQLQYLESQLQPHFLFNALNTIQELAHEAPQSAVRMLQRLRALLALSLDRYGQDEIPLADELESLEPYLDIQRTRFSNWLTVEVNVDAESRQALVPRLVLQPLVENAIRHGLAVRQAPGNIEIAARRLGDRIQLVVRDDGVGLRPPTNGSRTGIGLQNVHERLRQLYGSDHRLELRSRAQGGVEVELEIPYRSEETNPRTTLSLDALQSADAAPSDGEPVTLATKAEGGELAAVASASYSPGLSLRAWLGIVGLWTLTAVFWTNQLMLYSAGFSSMDRATYDHWGMARLQFVTALIWVVLSFPVLSVARRFRFTEGTWYWKLPLHVVLSLVCAFVHLEAMRRLGVSSYPALSYANLNPLTGDFFIYFALLGWSHTRDFVAWFRARDIEAARLAAQVAQSRFQALRVQLRPEFIDATLVLLTDLVLRDVDRAERLIARLADMLRLTLDLGRSSVVTFQQELELIAASVDTHRLGVRHGVRFQRRVPQEVLSMYIPSRLVCTVVDELLANVGGSPDTDLVIDLEAHRVSGAVQVTVRAMGPHPVSTPHLWWRTNGVAERAVSNADSHVAVLIPDPSSVMLMIGVEESPVLERVPQMATALS